MLFRLQARIKEGIRLCKSPAETGYRDICPRIAEKLCMNSQGGMSRLGTEFFKHVEEKAGKVL